MNPYPQFRQNLIPKSNIVSFSTDPAGIRSMIERLTVFCMEAGVAIIYVHHHSKGNQALKESLDRGSGAGSWSRDPDCVIDLADQDESTKENPIFSAEVTVGDFPSIQKFVVCWQFPVLLRDDVGRDPDNLKKPNKAGRPPSDASEQILTALRAVECVAGLEGLKTSQFQTVTGLNVRTLQRHLKGLLDQGRLAKCVPIGG